MLVDTNEGLAEERILSREGHFYKGSGGSSSADDVVTKEDDDSTAAKAKEKGGGDDCDNSEWDFQPVNFPHLLLDGRDDIDTNAKKIVVGIQSQLLNK